jgi:hypothetical protein
MGGHLTTYQEGRIDGGRKSWGLLANRMHLFGPPTSVLCSRSVSALLTVLTFAIYSPDQSARFPACVRPPAVRRNGAREVKDTWQGGSRKLWSSMCLRLDGEPRIWVMWPVRVREAMRPAVRAS